MTTRLRPGRFEALATIVFGVVVWVVAAALNLTTTLEAALPHPFDEGIAVLALAWIPISVIALRRWRQAREAAVSLGDLHDELARQARTERLVLAERQTRVARLVEVIDDGIEIALQPIFDLVAERVAGYEALARFADSRGPLTWFAEAENLGLELELELAALNAAFRWLPSMPPDAYLSVNLSPPTLLSPLLDSELRGVDGSRVVLELTEHLAVSEYAPARATLGALRARGFRLAVDDAGAGHSSLRHILELSPEIIKLDRELTHHIHIDVARSTLGKALVSFASSIGAVIVAEGIEVEGERRTVIESGVRYGQGFLLARPRDAAAVIGAAGSANHEDRAEPSPRRPRDTPAIGAGRPGTVRVVIADDTPDMRFLTRGVLERDGRFSVVAEVDDGVAAVQAVAEHRPDILVLDAWMPVMTGLEAVIRVRTVSPQTKVLILTASGVTESEARKAGAHAYHHKAGPLFWLPDALIRLHAESDTVRAVP